ncbi:MAG: type II/IV secretion system protein, partial [Bradyrhizobium sp.]
MSSTSPPGFADAVQGGHAPVRSFVGSAAGAALERGGMRSTEVTDPASPGFVDEIARQLGLPRIALAELLAAKPLAEQFSRRFLRETMVFPFQSADHRPCLAAADPRDTATVRAAELVFGGPIELVVASAEDIATALNRLAGDDEVPARTEAAQPQLREDDSESLRDLATGAPVVRAVNDLFEQVVDGPH